MFDDHMKTPATPERVFAMCKLLKTKSYKNSELKELLEPEHLGGSTEYYGTVRTAAEQLGLIAIQENNVSLAVDKHIVNSISDMRKYIIKNFSNLKGGLFYEVTKSYLELGDLILQRKSVSDAKLIKYMCEKTQKRVVEDDMRAWRFWGSFLGFGYLHDMLLLPNMYQYLMDVLEVSEIQSDMTYSFEDFIEIIYPYCEVALESGLEDNKLNYAVSNGLRGLHDLGIIILEHKLDGGSSWFLHPLQLHEIKSTVTHVTVRGKHEFTDSKK